MHYDAKSFSINGLPTIIPKEAGVVLSHSSVKGALSANDVQEIRTLYKCL